MREQQRWSAYLRNSNSLFCCSPPCGVGFSSRLCSRCLPIETSLHWFRHFSKRASRRILVSLQNPNVRQICTCPVLHRQTSVALLSRLMRSERSHRTSCPSQGHRSDCHSPCPSLPVSDAQCGPPNRSIASFRDTHAPALLRMSCGNRHALRCRSRRQMLDLNTSSNEQSCQRTRAMWLACVRITPLSHPCTLDPYTPVRLCSDHACLSFWRDRFVVVCFVVFLGWSASSN